MIDERLKTFDANHERHFLDQYFNEMKAGDFDENYVFNCEYENAIHCLLLEATTAE